MALSGQPLAHQGGNAVEGLIDFFGLFAAGLGHPGASAAAAAPGLCGVPGPLAGLASPVVLLQDESRAGGAGVQAGGLRDNGRATVIGAPSFGKGTVNFSQPLNDGGALFVTIRRWLTPNGVQIDGVGITPDVEAGPGPLDPLYDATADAQIFRAIEHLRSLSASGSPVPSSVAP